MTTALTAAQRLIALGVASTVLIVELRKLLAARR